MKNTKGILAAYLGGALAMWTAAPQNEVGVLSPEQQEILRHQRIVYLPDGQGGLAKTIRIRGINLQVVNGLGATNGFPANPASTDPAETATNGLGNLILGYNELRGSAEDQRTGSHNLVGGIGSSYASYGGTVLGDRNAIAGPQATAIGGSQNLADASYAAVAGGELCVSEGRGSFAGGGSSNVASGRAAVVSGGAANSATGIFSSVGGGSDNAATSTGGSVPGGRNGLASGPYAVVAAGYLGAASGSGAAVLGGYDNEAAGSVAVISGGRQNWATGSPSSITGGLTNAATGDGAWVGGGRTNAALGGPGMKNYPPFSGYVASCAAVTGGEQNIADSFWCTVSGGFQRSATNDSDWVAGGLQQNL